MFRITSKFYCFAITNHGKESWLAKPNPSNFLALTPIRVASYCRM